MQLIGAESFEVVIIGKLEVTLDRNAVSDYFPKKCISRFLEFLLRALFSLNFFPEKNDETFEPGDSN